MLTRFRPIHNPAFNDRDRVSPHFDRDLRGRVKPDYLRHASASFDVPEFKPQGRANRMYMLTPSEALLVLPAMRLKDRVDGRIIAAGQVDKRPDGTVPALSNLKALRVILRVHAATLAARSF